MISSAQLAKAVMRAHSDGITLSEKMRCTPAQARFIKRLDVERQHNLAIPNLEFVSKKYASNLIERLLACPTKQQPLITDKQNDLVVILRETKDYADETIADKLNEFGATDVSQLTIEQASALLTALFRLPKLNNENNN